MKNIYEILSAMGLEIPADKKSDFDKDLAANYKTVAEVEKKDAKITSLEGQLQTAKDGLKAFDGVDVDALKDQVAKLAGDMTAKETEYLGKIADMEFDTLLSGAVATAKGKNAKAIRALLDVNALKGSKNQTEDIKAALETIKTENGYLFDADGAHVDSGAGHGSGGGADYSKMSDDEYYAATMKKKE